MTTRSNSNGEAGINPSKGGNNNSASAVISVEVNTEGDVQLEDHDEMLNDMMMLMDSPTSALASTSRASATPTTASAAEKVTTTTTTTTTSTVGHSGTTTGTSTSNNNTILPASDLSLAHGPRHIWIVTTAALPWRTGTAVNPLLRALSLVHYGHTVTLLVPWLDSVESRQTLYGRNDYFESSAQQEDYIRQYCRERCHYTVETVQKLKIQFWNGVYQESFGSIFPTHDICSLIPRKNADVCILEEPEHLNWFRVPEKSKTVGDTIITNSSTTTSSPQSEPPKSGEEPKPPSDETTTTNNNNNTVLLNDDEMVERLGWAHKFRHVIGILHTNYADYVRQYGYLGTSVLTAPALNSLSSLVVKAYCHRVIRLSATLPHLDDESKEVTANVHGVRQEFLEPPQLQQQQQDEKLETAPTANSAVYFIGKLIWAKGFENVLHLQEKFKAATGEYFAMDIYGNGKDEKEIRKAFFGRKKHHHHHTTPRTASNISDSSCSSCNNKETDQKAAAVFATQLSLRDQLCGGGRSDDNDVDDKVLPFNKTATANNNNSSGRTTPTRQPAVATDLLATPTVALSPFSSPPLSPVSASEGNDDNEDDTTNTTTNTTPSTIVPLDIFGDLSEKTISTSVDTADAALKLIESVMLGAGFGGGGGDNDKGGKQQRGLGFHIAPAKTRFKWRRNPIPAQFLGVQDHIVVRDIPEHKIFLNMSTSEVLCTTSAEALAMGKFAVLPKHPSNEFFLQFPNCLAYESMDQCVLKLQYALENDPEPLTEQQRHMLSWEGATERLITASAITEREAEERRLKGLDKADLKAAKFHVDAAKKSQYVGSLLRGKILK